MKQPTYKWLTQEYCKHDPENGVFGDCWRTCIACLLHIDDPTEVPHFAHPDMSNSFDDMFSVTNAWLVKNYTCRLAMIGYPGTNGIGEIVDNWNYEKIPMMICGMSPRGLIHAVVFCDGEVVCDPNSEPLGEVGKHLICDEADQWELYLIVRL